MKICLVTAFPPSSRPLNEYSYHIARELQRHPEVELTILADELEVGEGSPDAQREPSHAQPVPELPGVTVIRCWKYGSLSTPIRLLNTILRLKPDVVWYNLVFSTFGPPSRPFAAFAGLSAPALTRATGHFTHITLHHIVEHVDLAGSGVRRERFYRMGADAATRTLLKAHGVSVLLSTYRRTLMTKYAVQNVLVGTHGTFTALPIPPDFSKRGNPERRILAFGHWGTYKRLERLLEAFPAILKRVPDARLIIAGGNHPAAPGYLESIQGPHLAGLPIEFLGYVPQNDVAELFRTSSVLVMPYDSSTGSSGPAHQACEYGLPIVCADLADFRCMAADDDMAIRFYAIDDPADLTEKVVTVLQSPELQRQMSIHNYEAGVQMTMATVARTYLRWFELQKLKRTITGKGALDRIRRRLPTSLQWSLGRSQAAWTSDLDSKASGIGTSGQVAKTETSASGTQKSPALPQTRREIEHADRNGTDGMRNSNRSASVVAES